MSGPFINLVREKMFVELTDSMILAGVRCILKRVDPTTPASIEAIWRDMVQASKEIRS